MLSIGLIGCGKIAQVRHLPEYADNPNCTIAGLYDINQERAKELAERYGAKAYASSEELLSDPAIDAVSICSANKSHAEMTIKALRHGKHVLCEKPMATTLEECEAMTAAAKESGRLLMIGQNQRLAAAHVKARELIRSGEIGEVLTFRTTFAHSGPETWCIDKGNIWFFDKNCAAMGVLADLGIHKTDLIQFLVDQTIVEVTAKLTTRDKKDSEGHPITVDDNAMCIYTMDGGCCGTMTASWTNYSPEDNSTVLYGTRGVLRIYETPEHSLVLVRKDGTKEYFDVDQIQTNDCQTKSGVIDRFIECILDPTKEAISADRVITSMRAVFGAIESDRTGKSVRVNV